MKTKNLLFILAFISLTINAQNPTRFANGVQVTGGITTDNNATKVVVQSANNVLNTISKTDLQDAFYFATASALPVTGITDKLYITRDDNKLYRFNGTIYVLMSADVSGKENTANKQNSLAVDGTGVKFPTVDAVNSLKWIKSNESLSLAQRKGDVLYGILDQYTGEETTLSKVTGTPTVDGIVFFQLGGEYFKRNFSYIRPEWFGAKGDNATDDTAALVLTMSASIGEIVQLTPKKIYLVSGSINTTGLTLLGYGATIKVKNSATVNFNGVLVATNGCVIKGVTIDLNKANTTNPASQILGNGVYMNPPSWTNFIAEDVTILNGWQFGFFLSGQGGSPFNNNAPDVNSKITNCKVYNCDVNNFHVKHVRNVTLEGCVSEGSDLGFYFTDAGEISVINSQANNTLSSGYSITYSLNCSVENSTFKNNGTNGIQIGGGDPSKTQNQNTKVLGNTVHNSTLIGITVDPTVDGIPFTPISSPCLVSGNTVSDSGFEAINLENACNVSVIGNSVRDTALTRSGIRSTNGKYNVISNNIVINCGDYGIAFFGVGGNGAGYSTILGNRVEGSDISEYTVQLANVSNMYGDFLGGEKMQISGVTLSVTPTTSAGSYDFLTRNSSTGVVEKVLSSALGVVGASKLNLSTTAGSQSVGNANMVGGTVTVTTTAATTNSVIMLTRNSVGITGFLTYTTANGSFTINSNVIGDAGVISYVIFN